MNWKWAETVRDENQFEPRITATSVLQMGKKIRFFDVLADNNCIRQVLKPYLFPF